MSIDDQLHALVLAVLATAGCSSEGAPALAEDTGTVVDAASDLPGGGCPTPRGTLVETVQPLHPAMCQPAPSPEAGVVEAGPSDADAASSDVGGDSADEPDVGTCDLDCSKVCAGLAKPSYYQAWSCSRRGADRAECLAFPVPCGRRTAGQADFTIDEEDAVARYQRESAFLEHLAIEAFARLAHELSAHHAPRSLVERALVAADDERRHAHTARALFGGDAPAEHDGSFAPRDLEAIAVENAIEGCVREAYGALVATHQAAVAEGRGVRGFARAIARDERRHAALAFDVARWLDERLDGDARRRVSSARSRAFDELLTEVTVCASSDRRLGLPTPLAARELVEGLRTVDAV